MQLSKKATIIHINTSLDLGILSVESNDLQNGFPPSWCSWHNLTDRAVYHTWCYYVTHLGCHVQRADQLTRYSERFQLVLQRQGEVTDVGLGFWVEWEEDWWLAIYVLSRDGFMVRSNVQS